MCDTGTGTGWSCGPPPPAISSCVRCRRGRRSGRGWARRRAPPPSAGRAGGGAGGQGGSRRSVTAMRDQSIIEQQCSLGSPRYPFLTRADKRTSHPPPSPKHPLPLQITTTTDQHRTTPAPPSTQHQKPSTHQVVVGQLLLRLDVAPRKNADALLACSAAAAQRPRSAAIARGSGPRTGAAGNRHDWSAVFPPPPPAPAPTPRAHPRTPPPPPPNHPRPHTCTTPVRMSSSTLV